MRFFLLISLLLGYSFLVQAQVEIHEHDHEDHHNHNGFELGVGIGAFYMVNETEWAPGAHLHSVYNVGKFGFGVGFEAAFAEVKHYGIGAVLVFRPMENLELSVGPGVLLENEETGKNLFAMHFEAIYSWEIADFGHLGPVIGYGFAGEDEHLFLGLHLGIDLK